MEQPLEDVRVLDLGQIYQGPYCGLMLSYLGADVIKIEPPGGENIRYRGDETNKEGRHEQFLNATKRGIELDLKTDRGKRVLKDLVRESDVLLENFSPGTMSRLGVGYETLSEINPELIYAQGSGFGADGPYGDLVAMDLTIQALGGVMETTGFPDGPPTKTGPAFSDFFGGSNLLTGITTALYQRERTGEGQFVEVAMFDSVFPTYVSRLVAWAREEDVPPRTGNLHTGLDLHPFNAYETEDGYIVVICVTEAQWAALAREIGRPEFVDDDRFATKSSRATHRETIDDAIDAWLDGRSKHDAVDRLRDVDVPCAPVQTTPEIVSDPQLEHRNMLNWLPNKGPGVDEVPVPGRPIKFSGSDDPEVTRSPLLGEHTEEVLSVVLGYSDREITTLREDGVV